MRRLVSVFAVAAGILMLAATSFPAAEICTLVVDANTRQTLVEAGDCTTPATPASTFKIPLAVIGFDTGVLVGPHSPALAFQPGDPDWGGPAWREDTDPAHWMEHSVVWYSQRITHALGTDVMTAYVSAFGYGNADFSGDPGADNGLERAWISSSLTISPRNQADFLLDLLDRRLPVSPDAIDNTLAIIQAFPAANGWTLHGKTGGAYPRNPDASFDYARGWGWFVGWADAPGRRLVFVRLTQDEERHADSPGLRARDALIADWPALVAP